MTDDSEASNGNPPSQSCYHCTACGCAVHQSRVCCPECGAFPGEETAPSADLKINLSLSLLLGVILCIALLALSRNREEAARAEAEKFSRLNITLDPNGQPPPVVAQSTPTPVPTAIPLPPTPTPIPFKPEDLAPKPGPTPRPLPTSVPPTPTPIPEPTRSSTLDLKDQLAEEYRRELDEKLPIAKAGDYIRLTLLDKRAISGTISRMDANQLALQTTAGQRWILYRQLARESRMRVDKSERDTWVEEKALEEVLKRLQN